MKKTISCLFTLLLVVAFGTFNSCTPDNFKKSNKKAKYVFYFIGDGMGIAHVSSAEAYLAARDNVIGSKNVSFSNFPIMGVATTHSANKYITDSAAAGTALATGSKTNNDMLGVDSTSTPVKSIAYKFKEAGRNVGIMTTVSIDHATPAAFYANQRSRGMMYEIGKQLGESNFDFFGGACFVRPNGNDGQQPDLFDMTKEAGYSVAFGMDEYNSMAKDAEKIVLFERQKDGYGYKESLAYAIDRKEGDLSLSDLVKNATDFLSKNNKGFFMMAEGGQIDWGGHANDAATIIKEVLDLSDAVEIALEFYRQHPDETLIVVTADHETGGMALGINERRDLKLYNVDKQANSDRYIPHDSIRHNNRETGFGFTRGGHTGIAVPVYAIGAGSELFSGKMDNTDIPKRIVEAAGVAF